MLVETVSDNDWETVLVVVRPPENERDFDLGKEIDKVCDCVPVTDVV